MTEVIQFPDDLLPDTQTLIPDANQSNQAGFSGAENVLTWVGSEKWLLRMKFSDLTGMDRGKFNGFVTRLRLSRNVFLCVNHTAPKLGAAFSAQVTSARASTVASAGAMVMMIEFAGGATDVSSQIPLRAGDFFSVNSELKMCVEDVPVINASDVGSVHFWPPIRQNVASGTFVDVNTPTGAFRASEAVAMQTSPPGYIGMGSISAKEYVDSSYVSDIVG